jgi:predicted secreted hydrolase
MIQRHRLLLAGLGLVVVVVMAGVLLWSLQPARDHDAASSPPPPWGLLEPDGEFARVSFPHAFAFPRDHGPHDEYRTEWWNLTGTLEDPRGRRLGLQLALVRLGLAADPPERESRWGTHDVYAGTFSLSDPDADALYTAERVSRGAAGLAGAGAEPRRLWVEDWRIAQDGDSALALEARSLDDDVTLNLKLRREKPLIDENAVLGRNDDQGPPFHFYLEPRLRAEGVLRRGGDETPLRGAVSMEHAWGELPLPGGPVALDRFTLHLDDGRDLLLSRTHRVDGGGSPRTTALLIEPDGSARALDGESLSLEPTGYWDSDRDAARYPVRWSLRIPRQGIELTLSPYREDQAGATWLPFWAGAVRLERSSGEFAGDGFVQLTGYETNE